MTEKVSLTPRDDELVDSELLARVEEAGINASAPGEQRWIDGWLVRFSPGKAKRARCIQAVAAGRLPIEAKLARCLPIYAAAGLRPCVRITPFSAPAGLDEHLASVGWQRIDDTRVMVQRSLAAVAATVPDADAAVSPRFRLVEATAFAEWIGGERGSSASECRAHAERMAHSPVPSRALLLVDDGGAVICGGQVAVEAELAGLYDVATSPAHRGRGFAEALCRRLLADAVELGARVGYLQVDAGNEAARRLYARLGFVDAYAYHYRSPPAASG